MIRSAVKEKEAFPASSFFCYQMFRTVPAALLTFKFEFGMVVIGLTRAYDRAGE